MIKILKGFVLTVFWSGAALLAVLFLMGIFGIVAAFQSEGVLDTLTIKTDRAIGVAKLEGEIVSSDQFRKDLQKLLDNEKIRGIVVRIDSPGGSSGASEEIYRAIKDADDSKPVLCSLGNLAASGGLYSAVGCRKIVTNKGTLTGSIGVILMMPNVSAVLEQFGVSMNVVKSGTFKDTGSPFRPSTPEERELLQSLVGVTYEQFVAAIAEGRKLDPEEIRKFADGRIILGEQAVELGLADEIGGVARAATLALQESGYSGEEAPEIIELPKPSGIRALFQEVEQKAVLVERWLRPSLLFRAPL